MTTATLERPCGCPPKASTGPSVLGQRVKIMESVTNSGAGGQRVHIADVGKSQVGRVSQTVHIRPELITCSCGVFVIGGRDGKLSSSINGTSWTAQTSGFGGTSDIEGAAWGAVPGYPLGLFVIVGESGKLALSEDAATWDLQTSSFGSTGINHVVWAPVLDLFLAVGDSGKAATGVDVTWTQQTTGFGTDNIYAAAWSPELGLFVIAGTNGTLATSPDGAAWTLRTSNTGGSNIGTASWSPDLGLFIIGAAGGELCTSSDGITWTPQTSGFGGSSIESSAWSAELGLFVIVGDAGKLATSPDGTTWTSRTSGFDTTLITAASWSPELGLFTIAGSAGKLATSPDGTNWTQRTSGFGTTNIRAIADGTPCIFDNFERAETGTWGDTTPTSVTWATPFEPSGHVVLNVAAGVGTAAIDTGWGVRFRLAANARWTEATGFVMAIDFPTRTIPGAGQFLSLELFDEDFLFDLYMTISSDAGEGLVYIYHDGNETDAVKNDWVADTLYRLEIAFRPGGTTKARIYPLADEPPAWLVSVVGPASPLVGYLELDLDNDGPDDPYTWTLDNITFTTCPEE